VPTAAWKASGTCHVGAVSPSVDDVTRRVEERPHVHARGLPRRHGAGYESARKCRADDGEQQSMIKGSPDVRAKHRWHDRRDQARHPDAHDKRDRRAERADDKALSDRRTGQPGDRRTESAANGDLTLSLLSAREQQRRKIRRGADQQRRDAAEQKQEVGSIREEQAFPERSQDEGRVIGDARHAVANCRENAFGIGARLVQRNTWSQAGNRGRDDRAGTVLAVKSVDAGHDPDPVEPLPEIR
jgi:hypothetical protein